MDIIKKIIMNILIGTALYDDMFFWFYNIVITHYSLNPHLNLASSLVSFDNYIWGLVLCTMSLNITQISCSSHIPHIPVLDLWEPESLHSQT